MADTKKLPPPFSGPPPKDVPLKAAPLARVIAQVRFPSLLTVTDPAAVAPFQERIRDRYPVGNKELIQRLVLSPDIVPIKAEPETVWRFASADHHWRASLSSNFLALEVTRYTSRNDFLGRMRSLIEALEQTINPRLTQRVGLRYINRIDGDALTRIHELIQPDFLGGQRKFGPAIRHMLTDAQLNTEDGAVITMRWGSLPANATTDPAALEPATEPSWVLDIDIFADAQAEFTAAALGPQLERFAERIYAVFRFMVTDKFLEHYGRS